MFPHEYFAGGYFAPTYFPPAIDDEPVVPPVPAYPSGSGGFGPSLGYRFPEIDEDDEFFVMLT